MGIQSIAGGYDTTRVPADPSVADAQRRVERDNKARHALSVLAVKWHAGARDGDPTALLAARLWRDEMYAALGLNGGGR